MRIFTALILLIVVSSCKYVGFRSGEDIIAQVGDKRLYKSDVRNLIPQGTPPSDSIMMLRQYVNSWALKYLLLAKAENELSKSDKDVEREVEDYRNSLIAFRFEKQYIERRLDTLVTEREARDYYLNNPDNFTSENSVVKARIVKISAKSPNLERIRQMYRSESLEEIDELERLAFNSADRYVNFNNQWTPLSLVARELPLDLIECERTLAGRQYIETSDSLYNYFAYVQERIPPGGRPPFEYYESSIKEIIISRRKQNLIARLEKDLIREALEKNLIKTNINDYP